MSDAADLLQQENLADFGGSGEPDFKLPAEDAPAALEALLFAAGDPIPLEKLQQILGLERSQLRGILLEMAARYARDRQRGLMLREIEGSWLLCTKPGQGDVLSRLFQPRHRPSLSQAAYETLAIIAYNQPVTRSQVEAVRGVNSDTIISRLAERNLICEAGSLDAPGRPTLFTTTGQFLLDFGLRSVKDLPPMEMMMYGTLQDFEQTLENAASRRQDKQVTIEQMVQGYAPDSADPGQPDEKSGAPDADCAGSMPDAEVLQISEALFGDQPGL